MLALSLLTVLEELTADPGLKNFAGDVRDAAKLLDRPTLAALSRVAPVTAFLAFHPGADQAVADYVRGGALAADSGPNLLVLFALDAPASAPVPLGADAFTSWIDFDARGHPSYDLVRLLFADAAVPPLPGIVFFQTLDPDGREPDAVYVGLAGLASPADVAARLREVLALADEVGRDGPDDDFGTRLGARLAARKIRYERTGRLSLREWLIRGYQVVGSRFADLVSIAGLVV
ncbi:MULTISPECIES: hypothetical protein [Pseudofrankia]|uniref:hypothetical protein n=1 Tax=Pseudofrankia TaxID=2994363 RepID=UPI000234B2B4|nr:MULTISPECIES: hypothetical protein [Pseudofrankia]